MDDLDYELIRNRLARVAQAQDLGDADAFVASFTEDGVLDSSEPEDGLLGRHEGTAALRRFAAASLEYTAGRVRHDAVNTLIQGEGDVARATSYVIITRDYGPPLVPLQVTYSRLVTTGVVDDLLRKVGDDWLVAERVFRHDGLPDVLDRVGRPVRIGPAVAR